MREPGSTTLKRYDDIAHLLTGDPAATAEDGIRWLHELLNDLRIPPLSAYGVTEADFSEVIKQSAKASSTQGNPIPLTPDEMETILRQASGL